jgi:2-pyrone-4,6-dicarboxylate lactonase
MNGPAVRAPTVPGAIRDVRAPKLKMPPGSCDCHAHVFGPQAQFPYLTHAAYIAPDASTDDYVRMLRAIGCERGVLVQPSVYGTDNRAMLAALRSQVFAFRGVAVIDESIGDNELADMHAAGVRGVRINFASATPGLTLAQAPRLADRLKAFGWHLQFFMKLSELTHAEEKLSKLKVDLVIDHFAQIRADDGIDSPLFRTLLNILKRDNVWAKIMGPYFVSSRAPGYADVTPFARAVVAAAPDRVIWGTDWPHPATHGLKVPMPNDGDLADMLLEWVPDEAQRKKVLVTNPARLYGFS